MLLEWSPTLYLVIEQPSGSYGFKQEFMLTMIAAFNLLLGFFVSWTPRKLIVYMFAVLIVVCGTNSHFQLPPGFAHAHGWPFSTTTCINALIYGQIWGPVVSKKNTWFCFRQTLQLDKTWQHHWNFMKFCISKSFKIHGRSLCILPCMDFQNSARTVGDLKRTMTAADRQRFTERFERRQERRAVKKVLLLLFFYTLQCWDHKFPVVLQNHQHNWIQLNTMSYNVHVTPCSFFSGVPHARQTQRR